MGWEQEIEALRDRVRQLEDETTELRAREAGSRLLVDLSSDLIRSFTPEGVCTYASSACRKMLGYEPAELLGRLAFELVHPDDQALTRSTQLEIPASGEPKTSTYRVRAKDGSYRWVETVGTAVHDEAGTFREFLTSSRDVTARQESAMAVQASEERFRSLISNLQVGIMVQKPNAEIVLSNPVAFELLGLTEDQMLGRTSFDPSWNVIHEDGSPFPGETHPVPQAIAQRRPVRSVVMGVHRPSRGDRVWILVDALPELDDAGNVRQVICTFTDISARKQAEDLVREQQAMLSELSTPLIPLSGDVMVIPLVGTMHPKRVEQVIETILPGVSSHGAKFLILDVTGVAHLDTQAVRGLVQVAQAVRLLGAKMIITGIRPTVARTLVELGVDMSGITTLSTLQSGIAHALQHRSRS